MDNRSFTQKPVHIIVLNIIRIHWTADPGPRAMLLVQSPSKVISPEQDERANRNGAVDGNGNGRVEEAGKWHSKLSPSTAQKAGRRRDESKQEPAKEHTRGKASVPKEKFDFGKVLQEIPDPNDGAHPYWAGEWPCRRKKPTMS